MIYILLNDVFVSVLIHHITCTQTSLDDTEHRASHLLVPIDGDDEVEEVAVCISCDFGYKKNK